MAQAQLMYVGTGEGLVMLSNPGRTDRWLTVGHELREEAIVAVACAADAPMQAVALGRSSAYRSADGGQRWDAQAVDSVAPPAVAYHFPGQPPAQLRLAGEPAALERSADDGASWTGVELAAQGALTVLAAPAYHPDTAYAGTAGGEIWQSTDRGRSWTRIKAGLPPVLALAIGRLL